MLTTLYGVIFARVIFLPAASKMQQREQIYKFRNGIVVEGFARVVLDTTVPARTASQSEIFHTATHTEKQGNEKTKPNRGNKLRLMWRLNHSIIHCCYQSTLRPIP